MRLIWAPRAPPCVREVVEQRWLHSAWDVANLYLGSVNAELLGPEAPSLLRLSQETTCFVSADYFRTPRRAGSSSWWRARRTAARAVCIAVCRSPRAVCIKKK